MTERSALVIVIDRLNPAFLGPYGNCWLETPHFNRLASESLLADHALTDALTLPQIYRSYWRGWHAAAPEMPGWATDEPPLPKRLEGLGVKTALLTDDTLVSQMGRDSGFSKRWHRRRPDTTTAAATLQQTQMAVFLAQALARLASLRPPCLGWLHLRGLAGPWDAPWPMRAALADEDDPDPPRQVPPPQESCRAQVDPDRLLGWSWAYAAQVQVLDECLSLLWELLRSRRWSQSLLLLTAPRGYPLGEHEVVGEDSQLLHGEQLSVPLFVRHPAGQRAAERLSSLVQPWHLCGVLTDWFGGSGELPDPLPPPSAASPSSSGGASQLAQRAFSVSDAGWACRTPGWFLTCSHPRAVAAGTPNLPLAGRLYAKPDDRFEVNDVAQRCPDVVAAMNREAAQWQAAAQSGDWSFLETLDPQLLSAS